MGGSKFGPFLQDARRRFAAVDEIENDGPAGYEDPKAAQCCLAREQFPHFLLIERVPVAFLSNQHVLPLGHI